MKRITLLILVFVGILGLRYLSKAGHVKDFEVDIVPPHNIEHFHFGYNDNLADMFWLRWIQNIHYCGKEKQDNERLERESEGGDSSHSASREKSFTQGKDKKERAELFKKEYVRDRDWSITTDKVCDKSWSFMLLDAVTKLSPKFRMPYAVGATTLSVLTFDVEGASIIFDRGVKNFPTDWPILYRAAYHFLYELNDYEKAAELYSRAKVHGAPYWAQSLASRLYDKAGRYDLAIVTLQKYYEDIKEGDPEMKKLVEKRIDIIKRKRDASLQKKTQ
ncbi:MAG: tetratricopeptide repeat protein [Bdellovibrionales bacterium]|nr:tetratricopeptide repeat protein [Bdellovibrionales bacterium]